MEMHRACSHLLSGFQLVKHRMLLLLVDSVLDMELGNES